MTQRPVYCIDTSALIDGWTDLYPPEHFVGLWKEMEALIEAERLIAPEEVRFELEVRTDTLTGWVKRQSKLFLPLDGAQIDETRLVMKRFAHFAREQHAQYWADPIVIALARTRGCIVVSSERGGKPTRPKIPWICDQLGIEHCEFVDIIRRERWRF